MTQVLNEKKPARAVHVTAAPRDDRAGGVDRVADKVKIGLLIIGRKRPGFDQEWNAIIRGSAIAALSSLHYDCVSADEPVVDDATISAALQTITDARAEALLVLQPSLGNGQLALTVMQNWSGPVVLWATPERPDGGKVSSCSLVSQHLWAATLRQARHPFELVYGHPDDATVRRSLRDAVNAARVPAWFKRAKVGLVGASAPGYVSMRADPFAMRQQLGPQLQDLSLVQFIERCGAIGEKQVADDLKTVASLALPMNGVSPDDLAVQSRCYLAMKELIAEEQLDALAMQEWPELPNVLGQWPYLAMSRLADEGFAVSMEGDADAAVTLLAAQRLGAGLGFITDWLEHDEETITFWHPGTAPLRLCQNPSLGVHFNIAKPMVIDGLLRVDEPVTIARLWRCDDRYHVTAFEGRTIPPRRELSGNHALVQVDGGRVRRWFDDLCHAGMPHHPVLFYGRHADQFRRLARLLGINFVEKIA